MSGPKLPANMAAANDVVERAGPDTLALESVYPALTSATPKLV
jgi:hypothetical protein